MFLAAAAPPAPDAWDTLKGMSNEPYFGLGPYQLLAAFGVVLAALILRKLVRFLITQKFSAWAKNTETEVDDLLLDAINLPLGWFIAISGVVLSLILLGFPVEYAVRGFYAASAALGGWFLFKLIDVLCKYLSIATEKTESKLDDQLIPIIRQALKVFVVMLALLVVVQNLGYSISGLIAGLSVGGAALALASQDTLSNFFGSVVIFTDRPFQIGDWIEVGGLEGTVEEVGFRSTTIRTFPKTLVTVPNSQIAHKPINNYSRMSKRRIKQNIGITYDATPEQMRRLVAAMRQIIEDHPMTSKDFYLVSFTDFGGSSLDILVYYFTDTTNWVEYLKVRTEVNYAFMDAVEALGLSFAFPTQTLHLINEEGANGDRPLSKPDSLGKLAVKKVLEGKTTVTLDTDGAMRMRAPSLESISAGNDSSDALDSVS